MVTVHDVARAAGVSISTVSRALSSPERVAAETRERVTRAAAELGYRPNQAASGLRIGRTHAVGLLVPDLENPYFASVTKAVQARARAEGYEVFVADTDEDADVEAELIAALASRTDGLVVGSPRSGEAELRAALSGVTAVLANRELPAEPGSDVPQVPSVCVDDADGTAQVLGHLHALGHRTIAIAAGPASSWSGRRRVAGLIAAAGRWDLELVELGTFQPYFAGGVQAADHAVASGATAVVAFNDLMALGILDRLRHRGVDVPAQMTVVGFDDVSLATLVSPALTTVRAPLARLGRRAVDLLLARLRGDAPASTQLPVELTIRGSSGPAPAGKAG
ncbi:LacI family DNA-binding transcriptional regulator [Promicromonospora thailandica]|uniref:Transcriptional regulator, LacI family n=1 Tax=Promicromonospora thailandica TaxID=765201 RepID=A0A9X2JU26_9MICO|nr:LacI family DNA-binding transcriptional regulator [Promicromonospora thailandica]MCP2263566.1 transcriptional regulator, LacI family [Promicromonospora thailandica]BFF19247.1 LacI family DNA-binding transcriptional regulator [Promicromonospora thailandica]